MHIDGNGDPVWRDGDVVKIRFVRKRDKNEKDGLMLSDEYEYVRSDGYWPGEAEWSSHTDHEMTAAWHDGRLQTMEMTGASADPDGGAPQVSLPDIDPGVTGVWIAYNDYGAEGYRNIAVFNDELEARRYATSPQNRGTGMIVGYIGWGVVL